MLDGSWDERWSQAETATAAAAVWRQRPGEHAQQALVNGHGSGSSAAETAAHGDAYAASSEPATSGSQTDSAHNAGSATSSSEHLLTPGHVGTSDSSSSNDGVSAAAATTLGPVANAKRQAEYTRNRERRRSRWEEADLSEGELRRRINISKSRAGRTPWNKGLGEVWPSGACYAHQRHSSSASDIRVSVCQCCGVLLLQLSLCRVATMHLTSRTCRCQGILELFGAVSIVLPTG